MLVSPQAHSYVLCCGFKRPQQLPFSSTILISINLAASLPLYFLCSSSYLSMLHQCGHQCSATSCSCGFAYGGCGGGSGGGGASFPFLFTVTGKQYVDQDLDTMDSRCSSPSLVDCTLSLGTPSTRRSDSRASDTAARNQRPSCMSNLCWDIISQSKSSSLGTNASSAVASLGGDPLLLARRCANCGTTSTPLWRNGPRGPKSLCNACGIRYKKEERRAAASTVSPSQSLAAAEQAVGFGYHHLQHQSPWSCYASDSEDTPYLSWQFNFAPSSQFPVRDRPSLFQYN